MTRNYKLPCPGVVLSEYEFVIYIALREHWIFFFLLTYNHLHDSGADNRTDKIPNKVLPHIILTNNYYRTSFTLQNKILNTYIYEQQSLIDERHLQQIVFHVLGLY